MKTLKNIFLAILMISIFQSCIVSEKPNMNFFSDSRYDFRDAKFTSFNVPMFLAKPYIKKALKEDGESEELIALVKKISKIKVLTVENGSKEMLNDYAKYLNNNHYEDWATIKHDGDNVNVRVKQNGDAIKNMLITVNSNKELVFVDVKGNFTTADISKMINSVSDK
ncbi:DUF4252 domain-containing protein [Chryseobacterium indologenes]|uniref:DUF4252 domain-containing protein n=1 Tax=Chryseobacterium indologenes TaxID=253 RepID=A0AAD0Z0W5_CHRID|nr:DUF4252 domain-containing protein [Chryseobacterium indologenes]ATN06853.1 DUF4252 domain-containing protein [Chryseobacterium indologenes]AYY84401.1 DUF4252 domain-containing protein [Chryseobacterium indologenes]AYZ34158.1 DUF4252 domain-containing protein [Chryseobacterium indologenes]AZB18639.1 DUF4252 domain-containing protein [Chryseobacterium indologenes]MBF6642678.1 DUF4252 domain-containing protein [Chryseobacterium indologenes]